MTTRRPIRGPSNTVAAVITAIIAAASAAKEKP